MKITEKDIFDFVFNPGNISKEKRNYIRKNISKFSSQIEYLKDLKEFSDFDSDSPLDTDFLKKKSSENNSENYN